MRALPTPGGSAGTWGSDLNAFLGEIFPAGGMIPYGGSSAPAGWLLCDGQSYLRADYTDLFNALGGASSPWGLPDGTHFNVPDLQGRMPVGKGTNTDVDTLAKNEGGALGSRRPKHLHTVNEGAGHSHGIRVGSNGAGQGISTAAPSGDDAGTRSTTAATTGLTVGPQSNAPTDGPAYAVVNYIIKT